MIIFHRLRKNIKRIRITVIVKIVLISLSAISIALNFNVYVQYGFMYQVFLGPDAYYSALLERINSLSSQLDQANAEIEKARNTIVTLQGDISALRNLLNQKNEEIMNLTRALEQERLRFITVSGYIETPGKPLEIIFKWSSYELKCTIYEVNGKYTYQVTLKNNKKYEVIIRYQEKILFIPVTKEYKLIFELSSNKQTMTKNFIVPG